MISQFFQTPRGKAVALAGMLIIGSIIGVNVDGASPVPTVPTASKEAPLQVTARDTTKYFSRKTTYTFAGATSTEASSATVVVKERRD